MASLRGFDVKSGARVLLVMKHFCIPVTHLSTLMTHQRLLLTPTIAIAEEDGRFDSPGHSTMFGAYSVLEVNLGKVLDIEPEQSNEVKSSYHMEKEGLSTAIKKLQSLGMEVDTIITDRHVQIQKWIRENMTATHYFDSWRVAEDYVEELMAALEDIVKKPKYVDSYHQLYASDSRG